MNENKFLTFGFEIKEVSEEGMIEGYASTFGNVDQGGDVVDMGAFKKTIKESKGKFPILSNHNPYMQVGWNHEAKEDDRGLWVRGKLDIQNNAKAKEHYSLIKQALELKTKPGLSIGYSTIKAEPDKTVPTVRRLKEVKLWEYSIVTFPMNTEAMATAAKTFSFEFDSLDENCKSFIEAMIEKGYSEFAVLEALRKREAAEAKENPDPWIQFLSEQVDQFQKTLRA